MAILSATTTTVSAFVVSGISGATTTTKSSAYISSFSQLDATATECDRRAAFAKFGGAFVGIASSIALPIQNANAGLLDEFGSEPNKIQEKAKVAAVATKKEESNYEPNLRSNYYYPTNKKRYLPRIKRCNDAIPDAAVMIGNNDWEGAENFAVKIADDTVLPMKLYTSSLLGGGTNVKVTFAETMKKSANDFEKAQKKLTKAIAKKDQTKSSQALEEMATALQDYRVAGKLLGPDGGGDIPSVDEIRRSACRVQGRRFEETIKARDARVTVSE